MTTKADNPLKIFSFYKIIIPVLIGLGVGFFMIAREYSKNEDLFSNLASLFTSYSFVCIFIAILFECNREFMYMLRLRLLSDKKLSWKKCFQIIMLWEFSSTVTPTSIGGSAVALFIIPLEGIGAGRSTAIVMLATLMDELFYILITPLVILLIGSEVAFATSFKFSVFGLRFSETNVFLIGYSFMMLLTLFIFFAIFVWPRRFSNWLKKMGEKKFFIRWQHKFLKLSEDILISSKEFKDKSFLYWLKVYGATVFSWSSRFLVLNFVLMAFNTDITGVFQNFVIYCRQLIMWIVLCISPTPGSSGVAEFAFPLFLKEFLPDGLQGVMALLWRLFTYYPYIIIGLLVLPYFTNRVIKQKQARKNYGK
ncbi:MAG: lysylphosphatidylglycerol synthase transmembrane domain-containing protein [Bacteroidota bacterium]|nr:lysylphosphatidylglycerol synthase transmembrane domain-containing protein [Bacteroidota bacterium]